MGKLPDERTKQKSISLFIRQWRRVKEIAEKEKRTEAEVLRYLLDWGLERYDSLPESGSESDGGRKT